MKKESFTLFMKQVAVDLQQSGNLGTAHVYRSTLNAILTFQGSGCLSFPEITPEWLKHFEGSLRARGCSWNTVSTYLRTLRAVYNRAVDLRKAPYVPHLFRSVYTGTRADRRRARLRRGQLRRGRLRDGRRRRDADHRSVPTPFIDPPLVGPVVALLTGLLTDLLAGR